jgi:hypothetical protein
VAKGFESSVPATPRNGQNVSATAFTDNENQGVVVALVPCPECSAAVEDGAGLAAHESWHAAQAGSAPKR